MLRLPTSPQINDDETRAYLTAEYNTEVDTDNWELIADVSEGSSLTITDDNEVSVSGVETINFTNATVTDNTDGSVDVTVPVGITVVDDDNTETYNNIEALIFVGATITDNEDGSVDVMVTQTTQTVKQAKVTIPSNDLKNCSSNPVTIIPAQGARTVINILNATAYLEYGSEAYSFDGDVFLRIGNNPSFTLDQTELNVIANNYMTFFAPTQSSSSANNSAVVLTSGSDSATGDSPVTIVVTYTVDNYN